MSAGYPSRVRWSQGIVGLSTPPAGSPAGGVQGGHGLSPPPAPWGRGLDVGKELKLLPIQTVCNVT